MTTDIPTIEKYRAEFEKHMSEVDDLALVILKGHLVVESVLDTIIALVFFHPEHIQNGRFGFTQKVHIARAYCLRKDRFPMWNMVLGLNELRNAIAHSLAEERRERKLQQLRKLVSSEGAPAIAEKASDREIVIYTCALSLGFLANYEHDVSGLREHVDALDTALNPDKERVPPKVRLT